MNRRNASPHVHAKRNTQRIMLDVMIALFPALAAGIWMQGARALLLALVCVLSACAGEWVYTRIVHAPSTLADGSAAVTGLLLAMTLPVSMPLWQAVVGCLFAVCAVKNLCGGLGENTFNPALAGRALMMLLFPAQLTHYAALGLDGVSTATPLHQMRMPALPQESLADLFLGRVSGSMGEISALALLLGGGYLLWRRVISIRIPAAYLGTVAALSFLFASAGNRLLWMLYSLLSGGVLLGAFFMATDYVSSPTMPRGQILYGAGCGLLTVFFRNFGIYPEGVTYAVLLMNACTWALDCYTRPRRFGSMEVYHEA